ncbi:MAG: aldolase/citrate lyase family protein [Bryobacteraceae bacterium]
MNPTLPDSLTAKNLEFSRRYPGDSGKRQPVHTVYGGAHLFKADLCRKMGAIAEQTVAEFAPDAATLALAIGIPNHLADTVYERVIEKLRREPVEDFRIDFEDGYGNRPDAEEDASADRAAEEVLKGLAAGTLPPFLGIRIKSLSEEVKARSVRTLARFLTVLGRNVPEHFVVTLPKITVPEQVSALMDVLDQLGSGIKMEMMVETPQAIFMLPELVKATRGRCVAAHFGTYDYTASLGITAAHQHMLHPACDFARAMMQASLAGTGLWLSDGATNVMPVAIHRGKTLSHQEILENRMVVHRAWKLHRDHVRHSLDNGFYQGWDLHPAQLPTRYATIYSFFLEGLNAASERLRNFISKAAQATIVGDVFDDEATGQGLLNYFLRAINCGAIPEEEVPRLTGLTLEELGSASFAKILEGRRAK